MWRFVYKIYMAEVVLFARRRRRLRRRRRRQYTPASYTASHVDHEKNKLLGFIISMRGFLLFYQFL